MDEVSNEVRRRAMNTFLWVALAFKTLETVHGRYAVKRIKEIPPGLSDLYDHMMARIENVKIIDPQDCKEVLKAILLAYRPPSLSELATLTDLPLDIAETAVETCGSFLTTKGNTVNLIHQSAKDHLEKNYESRIQKAGIDPRNVELLTQHGTLYICLRRLSEAARKFDQVLTITPDDVDLVVEKAGIAQGHGDISRRSIKAMSSMLKQNIYSLPLGFKAKDMRPPDPDPLAPIRYSCVFWADHLCLNGDSPGCKRELMDDGPVFRFLNDHFLRWLESLSLLGKLSDGVQSIRKLLHLAQVCLCQLWLYANTNNYLVTTG